MRRNFELIVFDWDGTLIDSAQAIVAALQDACRDLGLPVPADARARYIIGLGLEDAVAQVLPGLGRHQYHGVRERYHAHYLSRDAEISLFPGVRQMVEKLHAGGRLLAVATGKSRRGLERGFTSTGLGAFFHASRCADECFSKPHPQMLLSIMGTLGVDAEHTLMIGDSSHDLQMAGNAGVGAVAAAYGAHPKDALLPFSPLACVEAVPELVTWLEQNA